MSFEIDRPVHFLPQATYLKEDMGFSGMEFGHHQQHQHEQNDSIAYSPTFSVSSATNDGMGKVAYGGLPIPPYHHNPSTSALPMSASLYQVNTASFPDLDHGSLTSPTSISSPPKTTSEEYHPHHLHQQQQQLEVLSPLPTNTSMYTTHFTPRNGIDGKAQAPSIDMIQQQQQQNSMTWKQDLYSPPVSTNGPWTQQQPDDIYYPATPTPRSSSCSPPPQHHRAMPPCNCAPMMQYAPHSSIYNGSNAALPPYHGSSSTMGSSPHRSPSNQYPSYQRPSMDTSYDLTLNLSPSSSSSLSDDYYPPSHHHHQPSHYRRQRHSMNNNNSIMGAHPPLSSSSSSSSSSSAHRGTTSASASATTPRRYKCTVCVKRFTRPSSLATHMHSHTGEKPYKCMVDGCGRRFSVVSNLRRHAKIHLHANSLVGVSGRKLNLAS